MIPLELLHRFPFFSFMSDKELKAIATIAQELQLDAGEVLCEANTPADALYFLTTGNLPYYIVVHDRAHPRLPAGIFCRLHQS
jgi:CRP-like cAMP-binding protein